MWFSFKENHRKKCFLPLHVSYKKAGGRGAACPWRGLRGGAPNGGLGAILAQGANPLLSGFEEFLILVWERSRSEFVTTAVILAQEKPMLSGFEEFLILVWERSRLEFVTNLGDFIFVYHNITITLINKSIIIIPLIEFYELTRWSFDVYNRLQ